MCYFINPNYFVLSLIYISRSCIKTRSECFIVAKDCPRLFLISAPCSPVSVDITLRVLVEVPDNSQLLAIDSSLTKLKQYNIQFAIVKELYYIHIYVCMKCGKPVKGCDVWQLFIFTAPPYESCIWYWVPLSAIIPGEGVKKIWNVKIQHSDR